ncbi:MAG: sphingosine kinase [Magnetospirillum sp.]|nr:sphingosine kinase [Magnetospirillum sp.]
MRIALVINRSAGGFRHHPLDPTLAAVVAALQAGGHDVTVTVVGRRDLPAALSKLPGREDVDAVVIGGGDGTVLTAILAGLGTAKPLGVLPLGTLNLFAHDLGLPADPIAAARLLAGGRLAAIDLGEVNGNPFAIWASLGMHPWMVRRRDHLQRDGMGKWPAMALAFLRAFRRYPMVELTLTVDGQSLTVRTPLVVVSNNAWREETPPLSRRALDEGLLVVHVAKCATRLGLLRLAFSALVDGWKAGRHMDVHVANEVRVTSRKRRVMVSLDGEVTVLRSPLVFRLRPKALRVIMPAPEAP